MIIDIPPIDVTSPWPLQIYSNEKFEVSSPILPSVLDGRRRSALGLCADRIEGREPLLGQRCERRE